MQTTVPARHRTYAPLKSATFDKALVSTTEQGRLLWALNTKFEALCCLAMC